MSRTLSSSATSQLHKSQISDEFIILITIDHSELDEPLRFAQYKEDVISNYETYIAFGFDFVFPDDTEGRPPRAKLRVDNIAADISEAVAVMVERATCQIQVIRVEDPDDVEITYPNLYLTNINNPHGATYVEGELGLQEFESEPFPADTMSESRFPGLF